MSLLVDDADLLLSSLQLECQELHNVVKIFESQQQALIHGQAEQIQAISESAGQFLEQLEQASKQRQQQMQRLKLNNLQEIQSSLSETALKMRSQICCQNLIQQSVKLRQLQFQNHALVAQGQRLNEASLESLIAVQQGSASMYSEAGDYHEDWSPERRLCDFNA